jgi:LysM repeat protein
MNKRLRLFLVLGLLVLLALALAGCNRERPAVTNDKGTPVPGRGTVAAPAGSVTAVPTDGDTRGVQSVTPAAPTVQVQQPTPAAPQSNAAGASGTGFNYTVVAGDNLAAIAARFGTTVDAIARLNSIADPNALTLGQVLKIPGTPPAGGAASTAAAPAGAAPAGGETTYTVQPGDTLGRIAQRFNTTAAELTRLNGLANPDAIKVGQKLRVPGTGGAGTSAGQTSTGGRTHIVAQGETLGTIAKRYGVTIGQIQSANNVTNPDRIYVGQKLVIP